MDEILSSMLTQTKDAKAEDSVEENKSYPYSDMDECYTTLFSTNRRNLWYCFWYTLSRFSRSDIEMNVIHLKMWGIRSFVNVGINVLGKVVHDGFYLTTNNKLIPY